MKLYYRDLLADLTDSSLTVTNEQTGFGKGGVLVGHPHVKRWKSTTPADMLIDLGSVRTADSLWLAGVRCSAWRNLIPYANKFDDASWVKTGGSVSQPGASSVGPTTIDGEWQDNRSWQFDCGTGAGVHSLAWSWTVPAASETIGTEPTVMFSIWRGLTGFANKWRVRVDDGGGTNYSEFDYDYGGTIDNANEGGSFVGAVTFSNALNPFGFGSPDAGWKQLQVGVFTSASPTTLRFTIKFLDSGDQESYTGANETHDFYGAMLHIVHGNTTTPTAADVEPYYETTGVAGATMVAWSGNTTTPQTDGPWAPAALQHVPPSWNHALDRSVVAQFVKPPDPWPVNSSRYIRFRIYDPDATYVSVGRVGVMQAIDIPTPEMRPYARGLVDDVAAQSSSLAGDIFRAQVGRPRFVDPVMLRRVTDAQRESILRASMEAGTSRPIFWNFAPATSASGQRSTGWLDLGYGYFRALPAPDRLHSGLWNVALDLEHFPP